MSHVNKSPVYMLFTLSETGMLCKSPVYMLFTLSETGMLCTGPPDNTFLKGTIEFSKTNGIPVDIMEKKDIETKYPKMTFPEDYMFVLDQCAGILLADKALYAFQVILSIKIKFH